jgi:hypothetical protein
MIKSKIPIKLEKHWIEKNLQLKVIQKFDDLQRWPWVKRCWSSATIYAQSTVLMESVGCVKFLYTLRRSLPFVTLYSPAVLGHFLPSIDDSWSTKLHFPLSSYSLPRFYLFPSHNLHLFSRSLTHHAFCFTNPFLAVLHHRDCHLISTIVQDIPSN